MNKLRLKFYLSAFIGSLMLTGHFALADDVKISPPRARRVNFANSTAP
jgi:hypothetical protein